MQMRGNLTPHALVCTNEEGGGAVIADVDTREVDLSCVDTHKQGGGRLCSPTWMPGCKGIQPSNILGGALPIVGTAPALDKGTASIESASGAERASATQPEALEPRAEEIVEKLVRVLVLDTAEEFVSITKLVDKGTRCDDALICLIPGNVYVEQAEGGEESRGAQGDNKGWSGRGRGDIQRDLSALCFATQEDRGGGQRG